MTTSKTQAKTRSFFNRAASSVKLGWRKTSRALTSQKAKEVYKIAGGFAAGASTVILTQMMRNR